MFFSLTLVAVLLIEPTAARTDVSGGVAGEVRGGWAPVNLNEESTPAFIVVLTPNVDLEHRTRRRGGFTLGYSPRMFLRQPNRLGVDRPLVFHTTELVYDRPISQTWEFRTQGAARVGELDYTGAAVAFDPGQTSLPTTSVLSLAVIDGGFGFTGFVTPRRSLTVAMNAGTRRPIGVDEGTVLPFPDRVYGDLSVSPRFQVTRRDAIAATVITAVNDFDPGAIFLSGDARLAWIRRLRQELELTIDGGVFVTRVVARQDEMNGVEGTTFPVGGITLNGRLKARASYRLDGGASAGFFGLFDALSGRLLYRVRASTRLVATFPPSWTAGVEGEFVTAPTREPLDPSAANPLPETLATIQAPVRYTFDEYKNIEFGGVFTVRAPHLASQSFDATRYEAWVYLAFRISGGTARGRREVRERRTST